MKFKLLLLLLISFLWGGIISAQDTINYLVITEYRGDNTNRCYLELTNMGDKPVQLNQFKIGHWGGSDQLDYVTGKVTNTDAGYFIPVDKLLQPGESYSFAAVKEFGPRMFAKGLEGFPERVTPENIWETADFLVHLPEEKGDSTDMVTLNFYQPFNEQWGPGMNGFFLEQHFPDGDSIVVDQVLGMFTGENGQNLDRVSGEGYDVAGVTQATGNCYLIRRFNVKHGNLDFNNARGVGLDDSEWIPIPIHGAEWRLAPWTLGNHGDYNLDENTLESDVIDVDFASKTLTVPWGVQRGDDIMKYFVQKPGIGWEYIMAANGDSLTHAAQTGDRLLLYVCGNDLDLQSFNIVVKEPAADANMVVPVTNEDPEGYWRDEIDGGQWAWPRITQHASGIDSIWGIRGGIPYASRVDSLLERLDKPSNAEWEIIYNGGVTKPDLSHGDKLKVTANNGSVKEYFISVIDYRANSDATLSSITWPDIPEFYKGLFGWIGDTIPGFSPQVYNYNVQVPLMAEGIPALVAQKADVNANLKLDRANSLSGSPADRTVSFTVTAEDDSTINNYNVVLTKEKDPSKLQPYYAEPFFSEVSQNLYWTGSDFLEICNPGNQPLDLSNYMIVGHNSTNPAEAISQTNEDNWLMRYEKYIPGYKWAPNAGDWVVEPYKAQSDIAVNAFMQPGDVFALGGINNGNSNFCRDDYDFPGITQLDVQFLNKETECYNFTNPWREEITTNGTPVNKWFSQQIYLFKILNDSIQRGLKPATDPLDFELIDVIGMSDGSNWVVAGVSSMGNPFNLIRKPEIYKGNPLTGAAFGQAGEEVEWNHHNLNTWAAQGYGWPWRMLNLVQDIGKHYFITPTHYMSTISSITYKVSEGYSMKEQIKGIKTGTTVSDFLGSLIKANEGQSLKVTSAANGSELGMDALLSLNDVLTVLSADSTNTSKYVLEVSEAGLSSDAVLTSSRYEVTINVQPKSAGDAHTDGSGSVSGFDYGTSLRTVLNNLTVPSGALMNVINGEGAYVPLKQLNFDTAYVNVTVNADTYLEVTAENGATRIVYQLMPNSSDKDAFITSDVYAVSQKDLLIEFVPRGINVQSFMSNLVPSYAATLKLVDKMGFERTDGTVADDDKVIVTSANEMYSTVYHISKIATKYIRETTYLAYILSKTYMIDQVNYIIDGASSKVPLTEFYSKVTASMGATAVVVDKDGMEKNSGNITGTDKVKVTSADGRIEVFYTFGHIVSADVVNVNNIELYPNPTNGKLNITGLEKGQRIQIFNAVGSMIIDTNVERTHEIISIEKHPAGIYLIVVSDQNRLLGKYKSIKY